ncbi:MAG: deoxyribose-phosphate aldolase [Clostridiales bacterium]|nr:deoxyribose-phosphate aldolase [Clostridiales bacterium]
MFDLFIKFLYTILTRNKEIIMNKREIANYIEYTNLAPSVTKQDIAKICEDATKNNLRAVYVNPKYVEYARMCLDDLGSKVKLGTVVGYPLGENTQEIKAMEAVMAKEAGVDEIDIVVSTSAILTGNYEYIYEEVRRVVDCTECPIKVVYNPHLISEEQTERLCEAIIEAGAKYICVSTGYGDDEPTQEMIKSVADMVAGVMEVKANINVDTVSDLYDNICAGATKIGTTTALKLLEEFSNKK